MYIFYSSTVAMRSAGGIEVIRKAIDGLAKYHDRHIMLYDPTLVSSVCVCVCVRERERERERERQQQWDFLKLHYYNVILAG